MVLQQICNIIILIGGVVTGITAIMALAGKPIRFFRKLKDKQEEERCAKIAKDVEKRLTPRFDEIYQQNLEQEETIQILEKSSRDMLRKDIIQVYKEHKLRRELTETTKEYLDDLYGDYKAENGNHYIDKIYNRMCTWKVIPDED